MENLTSEAQELVSLFKELPGEKISLGEPTIKISQTVSAAAVLYEKARNAVEFREEHLIRRAAIERILKRRILTTPTGEGVAEALIRELLWARYLEAETVPTKKIAEIQQTIQKYLSLRKKVLETSFKNKKQSEISDWIFGIASCEIEKKLAPAPEREALINFVYQTLRQKIVLKEKESPKNQDIQIYIAVHRAYAGSDEPIIRFHLFLSYFPEWMENEQKVEDVALAFLKVYQEIESLLSHPIKDKLLRIVKKECPPFYVIRDMAEDNKNFWEILTNENFLEEEAKRILNKRYLETGAKLRRAAVRSIIYIFLTKMIFALILELPFDLFLGKPNFFALTINSLFPPFLMFLVTASISVPGRENTQLVIEKIKEHLYQKTPSEEIVELVPTTRNPILNMFFTVIYFFTYVLSFGVILWILNKIGFNILSQAIFLFFLTLIAFFGYRVRLITKDYVMIEKERIWAPVADFLFLPILRVGRWLSGELAQINFFIFFFDFIIEAPFKAFFEVIEEWIHFLRMKKEEITA